MNPKQEILKLLKKEGIKDVELTVPKDTNHGDYALPCFKLTKQFKLDPILIAKTLANKIKKTKIIKDIQEAGPYLNFFINKQRFADSLIKQILKEKDDFGKKKAKKEKVMVEYSQPNTHKGFHVGHLRNVSLGDSLVRIMRFNGFPVLAANYINDTGAHVAKCIWYYLKYTKGSEPKENKGQWLGKLYADSISKLAQNPELKDEVDEMHRKIESGDPELMKIWKQTRQWSLDDFNQIYKILDVKFDEWFYDNELTKPGKKFVKELLAKKVAKKSEGAVIVDLEKHKLDIALVLKSDNSALYLTKDFALAEKKFKDFKIERSIYVVAAEQRLHFQQLFKILDLYGFKQAKKCFHLSYELVMLKEGKMSSRAGNIVLFSGLLNQMKEKLKHEVASRHKDWTEKQKQTAINKIAIAAMKFIMLNHENNKVITFDPEKALDFEGETGPYIQYAHARICSIMKKYQAEVSKKFNADLLDSKEEEKLVTILSNFENTVDEVANSYKPHLMARYLLDLAQAFNEFYHCCPILQAAEDVKQTRLNLILSVKQILKTGLNLLGIEAPEEM
jgi:arginyl-tRNA synthetase